MAQIQGLFLSKLPREIRDQIYPHAIDFNIIFRYTTENQLRRSGGSDFRRPSPRAMADMKADMDDRSGPGSWDMVKDEAPLVMYKVPSGPTGGLADMVEYRDEVKKCYDEYITKMEEALPGMVIKSNPQVLTIMKTSRVELWRDPNDSLTWLTRVDPKVIAQITSLVIGKENVWGSDRYGFLQRAWGPQPGGGTDFTKVLEERCPNLKEVAMWMTDFEVRKYALRAPEALCDMLEAGTIDVVRFLLNDFDEDIDDHPVLRDLIQKEKLDLKKFEREHINDPHYIRNFGAEDARIRALGPRFAYSIEHPASWGPGTRSNQQFPEFTVVTFRRVGADGRGAFPTGDFDPNAEW